MRSWLSWWCCAMSLACAQGQNPESAREWATLVGQRYEIVRDVVYKSIGGFDAKVDVYTRYDRKPGPTMVYIHGGGWANGNKEQYALWFLPYLQLGMRVVSVQYRLAGIAPAPAAVKDCRCALYWIFQNAEKYGFDRARIALTGGSAGGHLVLLTGMLRSSDGFDDECSGEQPGRIAGIVNYYGPTDLVEGLVQKVPGLEKWLAPEKDQRELARRLSPLTYVRPGLPPVLTIHGDSDEMVPYEQAVKLQGALSNAGVPTQLITIAGGKHGRFRWTDTEVLRAQRAIEQFLRKYNLQE